MGLKIGTENVGGLKIGTEVVGGMKAGNDIIYRKVVTPSLTVRYTATVTSASGRGFLGYWHNNIGSIAQATYTLPNSVSAIIRQCMTSENGTGLIFVLSSGGLTTSSIDQFPVQVRVTSGSNSISYDRPSSLSTVGQGIRGNYTSGASAAEEIAVFRHNNTVTVELLYS